MDFSSTSEDADFFFRVARKLGSGDALRAAIFALSNIAITAVFVFAIFAIFAAWSRFRGRRSKVAAEQPTLGLRQVFSFSVAMGALIGGAEGFSIGLAYLYLLVSGEMAWSASTIKVLVTTLAFAAVAIGMGLRLMDQLDREPAY